MKTTRTLLCLFVLGLVLAACSAAAPTPSPTSPLPATDVPPAPQPTATQAVTFDAALYQDPAGRYELDYPAGWTVDAAQGGSRGGYVQFTSWAHDGNIQKIPAGESLLQVTVYLWDPKNDLDARLEMRKTAFESSGNTILEEDEIEFPGGERGVRLLLQTTDGEQSLVVIAELGEDYLEISGVGDMALLDAIIRTFRFTN